MQGAALLLLNAILFQGLLRCSDVVVVLFWLHIFILLLILKIFSMYTVGLSGATVTFYAFGIRSVVIAALL